MKEQCAKVSLKKKQYLRLSMLSVGEEKQGCLHMRGFLSDVIGCHI